MKYRVIRQELPQGQQPGELVELDADQARVFLLVGAVESVEEKPAKPPTRYARRDLVADEK